MSGASEAPEAERLARFIRAYLSSSHRDHPETGCGLAALGGEMGRMQESARACGTEAFNELTAALGCARRPALAGRRARRARGSIVATMVGAMVCARAVGDANLSRAILKDARESLLRRLAAPDTEVRGPRGRSAKEVDFFVAPGLEARHANAAYDPAT